MFPPDSLRFFQLQVPAGFTLNSLVYGRMLPTFYDVDADGDADLLLGTLSITAGVGSNAVRVFENRGGALATAFLYNPALLGELPGGQSTAAAVVADLNGDGQSELLVGSDDGELRLWAGLPAAPVATPAQANLVRNGLTGTYGPAGLSTRPVLTAGDLDGDGRAEVLVGSGGGGVQLLRSQPTGSTGLPTPLAARASQLRVYPNPAAGTCTVELASAEGPAPDPLASLSLHDALGRRVWTGTATGARRVVSLAGVAPGVYVLTATTAAGRRFTRRLSVVAP